MLDPMLVVALVFSAIAVRLTVLAAQAVRMRWQAMHDRRRQESLAELVAALPGDGVVEIDEVAPDGSRVRVRVSVREGQEVHGHVRT